MNKLLILCISAVLVLSACGGAESRKQKYLDSGLKHYNNFDCKKAKLEFRNSLQIDPKTYDALVGLSRCAIEDKEWKNAYGYLIAAIDIDSDKPDAKNDLAKLYLVSGDNDKAYELIEEVLNLQPSNVTAIALRGIFHLKNNSIAAARTDSQESITISDNDITAITLLTSLKVRDDKSVEAVEYIENLLDSSSNFSKREKKELLSMLLALHTQNKDINNIVAVYKTLIREYPDDNLYKTRLAGVYASDGKIEEAESLIVNNIESSKDKLGHVLFVDKYKTNDEATQQLIKYAEDGDSQLTMALASRYLALKETDLAENLFKQLADDVTQPEHIEAKNELAILAIKDNNSVEAKRLIGEVLAEQPSNIRALILRGSFAISDRDAPVAIADFRTVLRDQPTNTYAIRQLAIAYVLNEQADLAIELLQKAVAIEPNNKELNLLYARLQGKEQNYESAISTVNELLKEEQADLETIKTLFDLQIANKDYAAAKVTAESMQTEEDDNPLGYYLSGVLLQNENNIVEAEKQYLIALEKEARANEPLSGLVRLYLSQNQPDKAIKLLTDIIDKDPEYLVPYNLLGEVALSEKDYDLAKNSFSTAIEVNDQWWIPYRGLSLAYLAENKKDKALAILKEGYEVSAGKEQLGIQLAQIYYHENDRNNAIELYKDIVNKVPASLRAKNNLAMILVDENANDDEIQSAVSYTQDLESLEQPALLDTVGWVNYRAGNFTKAIEFLERSVALAPDVGELHYHLGMAYTGDGGDIEKAKHHLNIAVNSEQEFTGKQVAEDKLKTLSN